MPTKLTKLQDSEQALNRSIVDGLVDDLIKNDLILFDESGERVNAAKKWVDDFVTANHITLTNLEQKEESALRDILAGILQLPSENQLESSDVSLQQRLLQWKNSLMHAVYGQGRHIAVHTAHSSGMAADLLNEGVITSGKWGTDLDIKHCMKHDLTDPRTINTAGAYILSPVSLTEYSADSLNELLDKTFLSLNKANVNGKVSLFIPVNCGDNHWRLAKFGIANQAITSAVLWDSMEGEKESVKMTRAFKNFSTVTSKHAGGQGKADLELLGVQENGYSCMDYCIQEAYRSAFMVNAMTGANDPASLRLTIAKEIASRHPNLGTLVAAGLTMRDNGAIFPRKIEEKNQLSSVKRMDDSAANSVESLLGKVSDKKQVLAITPEDKEWQVTFDSIFAGHLQNLYDQHSNDRHINEKQLIADARTLALREVGFFSHKELVNNHSNKKEEVIPVSKEDKVANKK